jgi:tetratricopeptide (TPR) repeat protein
MFNKPCLVVLSIFVLVISFANYFYVFSPANKFAQAIDLYSQAIELHSSNAVYWANRAFAHTKLEEYGSAVQDATKAIETDPKYSKVNFHTVSLAQLCIFVRILNFYACRVIIGEVQLILPWENLRKP